MLTIEWEILSLVITTAAGFFIGRVATKKQIREEYIKDTVSREYPLLHSEIKQNAELLDDFIDHPRILIAQYPKLNEIFDKGIIRFIKDHHHPLWESLNSFKEIIPEGIKELDDLRDKTLTEIESSWTAYLTKENRIMDLSLSKERIGDIVTGLLFNTGKSSVVPRLLRYLDPEYKSTVLDGDEQIYWGFAIAFGNLPFPTGSDRDEVIRELRKRAEPKIKELLASYRKLKSQSDLLTSNLIALLQKYISDPI